MSELTKEEQLIIESRIEMMRPLIVDLAKVKIERDWFKAELEGAKEGYIESSTIAKKWLARNEVLESQLAVAREALEKISSYESVVIANKFSNEAEIALKALAQLSDAGEKKS